MIGARHLVRFTKMYNISFLNNTSHRFVCAAQQITVLMSFRINNILG